jgi:methionyl-tRNA formyltransferase
MVERADAGDIVDQLAVPILRNDDARAVYTKVTVAAEIILARSLPGLMAGTAPRHTQPVEPGQYFGRRRPEDGRIDWTWSAEQIHNLVRAVAPPFPGAHADVGDQHWYIQKTRVVPRTTAPNAHARLVSVDGQCYIECCDGSVLHLIKAASRDGPLILRGLAAALAKHPRVLS